MNRKILVLNIGSTSFKFKLFAMGREENELAGGEVAGLGLPESRCRLTAGSVCKETTAACADHEQAFSWIEAFLTQSGCLSSWDALDAIGYKAVHGGTLRGSQRVDETVLTVMRQMSALAPAHNPVYLKVMENIARYNPRIPQFVCFETAFHRTIPEHRRVYGVPYAWYRDLGIQRYGFHGASHESVMLRLHTLDPMARRVISLHLGGSSSVCAILDGSSIACSMGATPQSGLLQNNRVGDFDVFCLPYLAAQFGEDVSAVLSQLASQSGLLGLSGVSSDMRILLKQAGAGYAQAELAIRAYVDGIVGYIGMFRAYLHGCDALVFTGGIGCNSAVIRNRVCEQLSDWPVRLDLNRNSESQEGSIHDAASAVRVWCLEPREEWLVARKTWQCLQEENP
ncbi:MAG: acetate/propionate family kinase [Clostridiaceae bacterium]|nr:acetate/propionate family kinase [Clostridiaceae bacterium]